MLIYAINKGFRRVLDFVLQLGLVIFVWLGLYTVNQLLLRLMSLQNGSLQKAAKETFRSRLHLKHPYVFLVLIFVFFNIIMSPLLLSQVDSPTLELTKESKNRLLNTGISAPIESLFPLIVLQIVALAAFVLLVRSHQGKSLAGEDGQN